MEEIIAVLEKYNFWDGKLPAVGFVRDTYLKRIQGFVGNKLIKVFVGQRRAGKSYLLRQLIQYLVQTGVNPKNILYINKEYTDFDFLTGSGELQELVSLYTSHIKPKGRIYLFLDEVQDIQGWEHVVNSYSQDYTTDFEIFLSGSNSRMLSGELAGMLSGRYISFQIFPFSFQEFAGILNMDNPKEAFLQYMQTGGLPELFHLPDQETKRHYMSAIKDTVMLRDIIQRQNIKDARLLEDLFAFLVNNASNLISISSIVKYFKGKNRKTNYETISSYIDCLQNAFLVHKAERYSVKGKEIISGTCKYYINDPAFKNYIYPGFDSGIGYFLENIVFLQLAMAGYQVYVGHFRNREVDFIATYNARTIYFQVAYLLADQQTTEREYSALESIPDNYEKFIVSLDDVLMSDRKGIKHIQAWHLDKIL